MPAVQVRRIAHGPDDPELPVPSISRECLEGFSLETSLLSVETEESALVIMDIITSMETHQDGPSSPAATTPHLAGTEGL